MSSTMTSGALGAWEWVTARPRVAGEVIPRLVDCGRSFLALPRRVRLWVAAVLVPVNALPFWFLDTPTGRAAAAAALFVVLTNVPIMPIARGMSRLMAVPHLLAWVPLLPWLAAHLSFGPPLPWSESLLALALLVVNGISLVVDTLDTWRWGCGQRAIPGHTPSKVQQ